MSPRLHPEFDFGALKERANRERAEALYRLVLRPIADFFRHAPRSRRAHPGTHQVTA